MPLPPSPIVELASSSGSQLGASAKQFAQPFAANGGDGTLRVTVPVCPSAILGSTLKLEVLFVPMSQAQAAEGEADSKSCQTRTPDSEQPPVAAATDSQSTMSWNISRAGTDTEMVANWDAYSDSPITWMGGCDGRTFEDFLIPVSPRTAFTTPPTRRLRGFVSPPFPEKPCRRGQLRRSEPLRRRSRSRS